MTLRDPRAADTGGLKICATGRACSQHSADSGGGDSALYNSALQELLVRLTGFARLKGRASASRGHILYCWATVGLLLGYCWAS